MDNSKPLFVISFLFSFPVGLKQEDTYRLSYPAGASLALSSPPFRAENQRNKTLVAQEEDETSMLRVELPIKDRCLSKAGVECGLSGGNPEFTPEARNSCPWSQPGAWSL
jgi:hypothetical protein